MEFRKSPLAGILENFPLFHLVPFNQAYRIIRFKYFILVANELQPILLWILKCSPPVPRRARHNCWWSQLPWTFKVIVIGKSGHSNILTIFFIVWKCSQTVNSPGLTSRQSVGIRPTETTQWTGMRGIAQLLLL